MLRNVRVSVFRFRILTYGIRVPTQRVYTSLNQIHACTSSRQPPIRLQQSSKNSQDCNLPVVLGYPSAQQQQSHSVGCDLHKQCAERVLWESRRNGKEQIGVGFGISAGVCMTREGRSLEFGTRLDYCKNPNLLTNCAQSPFQIAPRIFPNPKRYAPIS